jgi:ubiquitin-conjugating enzyme E2 R
LLLLQNGDVCVSILHPPGGDLQSGELPCERWNPTQSVRTILLSVVCNTFAWPNNRRETIRFVVLNLFLQVSLLNEPNTSSPANVSASVSYRRWKESKGKDREYETVVRNLVALTKVALATGACHLSPGACHLVMQVEAAKDQVKVPQTMEEYCAKEPVAEKAEMPDLYNDDDYYNDYEDEDEELGRSSDSEAGQQD